MSKDTMTIRQAYLQGKDILTKAGLESPAFDAMCLMEKAFEIHNRADLALRGGEAADEGRLAQYFAWIDRRLREPLQYILGRWEFDGMALTVGEGVLVPREDTMALVEAAAFALGVRQAPRILDLCAGTGAVGLALARRIPDAEVVCVEWSDKALPYLQANLSEFGEGRVHWIVADVLAPPDGALGAFDAIVSNPPYVPSGDIAGLQWEVRREPRMALDGGADGLKFYRAICAEWTGLLRPEGVLAFEIGYDIREGVAYVMRQNHIGRISLWKDVGGIDRCIFGTAMV